jgi:putative flippase GtrA
MNGGGLRRWVGFNAVGLAGVGVQLALLQLMRPLLPLLAATAAAVELTLLHNYLWHERLVWRSRREGRGARLLRFHLSNGAVSMAGNLLLMQWLAAQRQVPLLAANLCAIVLCSLANYLLAEFWVFRAGDSVAG